VEEQQFLSIEQFNTLLNEWSGRNIKISKLELDDLDETTMALEGITYENEIPTIDGYEPVHTLQLNGIGIIQTENQVSQALPSSMYEIPLEDNSLYEFDGSIFLISTDRGVYKIELLQ